MTGDPVAWRAIEQGWSVLDADGNEVGKVDQVTGDLNADIFDGLTIGDGGTILTRARYVPSEHVSAIREGEVVLDLHADAVDKLEPYQQPVSEPLDSLLPKEDPSRRGAGANRGVGAMLLRLLRGRRF